MDKESHTHHLGHTTRTVLVVVQLEHFFPAFTTAVACTLRPSRSMRTLGRRRTRRGSGTTRFIPRDVLHGRGPRRAGECVRGLRAAYGWGAAVERQTVGKMEPKGVPKLSVVPNERRAPRVGGRRGGEDGLWRMMENKCVYYINPGACTCS